MSEDERFYRNAATYFAVCFLLSNMLWPVLIGLGVFR
jgi:hypothetical protein